jgi:hypothetical protein
MLHTALKRASLLGFWLLLGIPSVHAADCLDTPVTTQEWGWVGLAVNPEFVGDWRLYVSSRSTTLTRAHARVQLAQSPDGSGWAAQILLSYPANPAVGLPYTFQKVQIQYRTASGMQTAEIDWTKNCSIAGHSIFPGQEFAVTLSLPGTQSLKYLDSPSFSLWGSEN